MRLDHGVEMSACAGEAVERVWGSGLSILRIGEEREDERDQFGRQAQNCRHN